MKFMSNNESFSFETLRISGFAAYGGADVGDVLATAAHIGEGDDPHSVTGRHRTRRPGRRRHYDATHGTALISAAYYLHPSVPRSHVFWPAELPADDRTDQIDQAEGA